MSCEIFIISYTLKNKIEQHRNVQAETAQMTKPSKILRIKRILNDLKRSETIESPFGARNLAKPKEHQRFRKTAPETGKET